MRVNIMLAVSHIKIKENSMYNYIFIFLFFATSLFSVENNSIPSIGDKAPNLSIKKLIGKTDFTDASLNDFPGKIIILEFWATWCSPCIPAMDHLSELQRKYHNDIVILALTLESEKIIRNFLSKRPQDIYIGFDSDSSWFNYYDPQTIPHSIILNKQRKIVTITSPKEITDDKIKNLLKGESVTFKPKNRSSRKIIDDYETEVNSHTLYAVKLRASANEPMFGKFYEGDEYNGRRITLSSFPITMLYRTAYDLPSHKYLILDFEEKEKYEFKNADKYFFDLIVPEHQKDNLKSIMLDILNKSFHINAKLEKRIADVEILTILETANIKSSISTESSYEFKGPELNAQNIPLSKFVKYVENFSKFPVVDETGLTKRYDFHMKWDFADKNSFKSEIKSLGFKLEKGKREIEFLVLSEE